MEKRKERKYRTTARVPYFTKICLLAPDGDGDSKGRMLLLCSCHHVYRRVRSAAEYVLTGPCLTACL